MKPMPMIRLQAMKSGRKVHSMAGRVDAVIFPNTFCWLPERLKGLPGHSAPFECNLVPCRQCRSIRGRQASLIGAANTACSARQ